MLSLLTTLKMLCAFVLIVLLATIYVAARRFPIVEKVLEVIGTDVAATHAHIVPMFGNWIGQRLETDIVLV